MKNMKIRLMSILFILYLGALGTLCFLHGDHLPNITGTWMGYRADSIAHAAMFLPFIPLAFMSIGFRKPGFFKDMFLLLIMAAVGLCTAYATEIIQGQLRYRTFEFRDVVADCVGLAAGFAFMTFCIIIKHLFKRR